MGMTAYDVMETFWAIDKTSSRVEKERILNGTIGDPFMIEVLKYACDPFITFGITPPHVESIGTKRFDASNVLVWATIRGLAARIMTGNLAQENVLDLMNMLDATSSELLWRILSKDLRCGVTAKTVNKLKPGLIPTFEVMLSHKYEPKRIKTFPVAMEPKLDGLRAPCLVKDGTGKFFSRVGNHFPALDGLGVHVAEMVKKAHWTAKHAADAVPPPLAPPHPLAKLYYAILGGDAGASIALEGEALSGLFGESSGAVRRKSVEATEMIYHVFDAVPFAFMTARNLGEFNMKHDLRRAFLIWLVQFAPAGNWIRLVPRRLAHSHEEIDSIFEEYRTTTLASYLARGDEELEKELLAVTPDPVTGGYKMLEGAIVKPLDGTYQKKRSRSWLKMKNEETEDLRVIDAFEGEGKYVGKLGGLIVDRKGVSVRVGGGFSDAQREEFWRLYKADQVRLLGHDDIQPFEYQALGCEIIGRLIEVEFHEVTPDGSLRHPRFIRFRDDKDPALAVAAE